MFRKIYYIKLRSVRSPLGPQDDGTETKVIFTSRHELRSQKTWTQLREPHTLHFLQAALLRQTELSDTNVKGPGNSL
jgi:hypothetical protein